jgi:hypothetical protein
MAHRLVHVQDLALYWDTDTRALGAHLARRGLAPHDLQRAMLESVWGGGTGRGQHQHTYILKPVTGTGKLRRNKNPCVCVSV